MTQYFLEGAYREMDLLHVRMDLSQEMDAAGRFGFAKLLRLIRLIANIYRAKAKYRPNVLYYTPSGPCFVTVMRDVITLGLTRWLFSITVFHFHASGLTEYIDRTTPLLRRLCKIVYEKPDLAIHISHNVPQEGLRLSCKQSSVVANGIPDAAGGSILRSNTGGSRLNILFVANLCEDKGVLIAIQAVSEVLRAGADVFVTCLGMWQSEGFKARALALIDPSFRAHFEFPGVVVGESKWRYYRDADLFLFPTYFHSETFPVVLLEAMCFGLPAVASRWRGIPDVVEDGDCAILCEPRDVASCRDALLQLVNDPSLRHNMGQRARDRYLRCFTIEAYHKAMECALSQLKG
jgi:glycosyltransferase involved in cell wall biosynthesis